MSLFEAIEEEDKLAPESWVYTNIVMSTMKDGLGVFRWPRTQGELRKALRRKFLE